MNYILKHYYGMEVNDNPCELFQYQGHIYCLVPVENIHYFLEIYQHYRYLVYQCQCPFYTLVKNGNEDIISQGYILMVYHDMPFDFQNYLQTFLQPIPQQKIAIKHIKEQWIRKIDDVKDLVKQYAYSFKHNPEIISLIYYYTGLAENCICILNEILSIHKEVSIFMGLSLAVTVKNSVQDLMNPVHYIISSRMRHIVYLIKSHLMTLDMLKELLEYHYFDIYEILYLYARMFYPSLFFDEILMCQLSQERVGFYFQAIEDEKKLYQDITHLLSFYVSLPKISWINR